jgi:hypothetical protein
VLTNERLEDIWAQLEIGPWKSQRQLSQETGMSVGSTSKAIKKSFVRIEFELCMGLNLLMLHKGFGFVTGC